MKVVLSWLREFAPIEGTADQIAEQLTDLGMELESVVESGRGLDGIVLVKVLDIRAHPDADRIRLVDVDTGDGQALQICCGASNMEVGDLVPLATIGTTMPGGMEIAKRKMRGQTSNGMLCSARELELGEDHSGILIVDTDEDRLGQPIGDVLGITADVTFDFDALPNRPDTLSMMGVARDLAAHQNVEFRSRTPQVHPGSPPASEVATVGIEAPELCGRFTALVLRDVTVAPSPRWMAQRLLAAGMRPINNVVDVSNFVMLELGQPTHTYDLAKLPEGRLSVRWARQGEQIVTLDGVDRRLGTDDGVIVDSADRPIGIAGVMGGASTEISQSSTDVLVESAWWQPAYIARSAERLNLHSEASLRFKRGVDPAIGRVAALRVAELLEQIAGAKLAEGVLEATGELPEPRSVEVSPSRINALLGTDIPAAEMAALLDPIGFTTTAKGSDLEVAVPSWRPDSAIEADIAEEVARHYGMTRIPKTVPVSPHTGRLSPAQRDKRVLRATLRGAGISEAMPMPFLAPGDLESFGFSGSGYSIANPLVSEESILRTTLLPGLLKAVAYNERHRQSGVRLYELGHCFIPDGSPLTDVEESARRDTVLPGEVEHLGVVLAGSEAPEAVRVMETLMRSIRRWSSTKESLRSLVGARASKVTLEPAELPGLHPGRGALVTAGGKRLGQLGEVDPRVLAAHEISQRVAWLELDLRAVLEMASEPVNEVPVSTYPSSDIDLAFTVPVDVPAEDVRRTIITAVDPADSTHPTLTDVSLFDVFRSEFLGSDSKSLAFRIRFQESDRTLTDSEVASARDRIIESVQSTHGARLRT